MPIYNKPAKRLQLTFLLSYVHQLYAVTEEGRRYGRNGGGDAASGHFEEILNGQRRSTRSRLGRRNSFRRTIESTDWCDRRRWCWWRRQLRSFCTLGGRRIANHGRLSRFVHLGQITSRLLQVTTKSKSDNYQPTTN